MSRIKKMLTRTLPLLALLLAPLGVPGPRADEGRIPIYKQTTITAPGHYVVTRDFSFSSGTGVFIKADNVTLDLNGHTITGAPGANVVIRIDTAFATRGIVIRNGRLISGSNGVFSEATNRLSIRIEGVEVGGPTNSGINITAAASVEVLNCYVHDVATFYGIRSVGVTGSFTGTVSNNTVDNVAQYGILLDGLVGGEVRRNVVTNYGSASVNAAGINLFATSLAWGAGGSLVEGNTVTAFPAGTDDDGIRIGTSSPNNLILSNVVNGCRYGITSTGDGTRIERNLVSNSGIHGILAGSGATGSFIHVEENQTQANLGAGSCGIRFDNSHVARNNNVRNNTVAGVCNGVLGTNTDGGGNIP